MRIANPIYDVVFKYMMEDNEVAKLLISTIIDQDIIRLDFMPQEHTIDLEKKSLTVYRLDFKATIKTKTDEKLVVIEVQKAKFSADVLRFRRYLGEQYANEENRDLPIISIYFLGYSLEKIKAPVVKIQREYIDLTTNKRILEKEKFIESLTHDSFVIQVENLSAPYVSEIEKFLSIFDQSEKRENSHMLEIKDDDYPIEYNLLLRRLQKAALEVRLRREMDIEDEIVAELDNLEREIEKRDNVIEERDKQLFEKDNQLSEKDNQLSEKDKLIAELKKKLGED